MALVLATAGGMIACYTIRSHSGSDMQTVFETATFLLAAGILIYMRRANAARKLV
jgi:hypothetical protein